MRLIDADALIHDIEIVPLTGDGGVDVNDLEDIIKRQHEIEPERKKGKWIKITDREIPIVCKCTECGWLTTHYDSFSFCPNCGSYNGGES